jgi:hypothetical protein
MPPRRGILLVKKVVDSVTSRPFPSAIDRPGGPAADPGGSRINKRRCSHVRAQPLKTLKREIETIALRRDAILKVINVETAGWEFIN